MEMKKFLVPPWSANVDVLQTIVRNANFTQGKQWLVVDIVSNWSIERLKYIEVYTKNHLLTVRVRIRTILLCASKSNVDEGALR